MTTFIDQLKSFGQFFLASVAPRKQVAGRRRRRAMMLHPLVLGGLSLS